MVVDLQQNVESINVTMSCPVGEQSQQLRVTPKKDRRKPKVPAAATTPHILLLILLRCSALLVGQGCSPHSIPWCTLCRCQASQRPRAAATTRTGCASCTPSPAQPGAPPASGGPRAAAGSLTRSQPPSGGGERGPVPIPCNPGPGIMAWKHRCRAAAGEPALPSLPVPAGPISPWR